MSGSLTQIVAISFTRAAHIRFRRLARFLCKGKRDDREFRNN